MWVAYYWEDGNSMEGPKGHKYFKSEENCEEFLLDKEISEYRYREWVMEEIEFEDDEE